MSTFRVFPHFLLKFKPFEELFASQNVIANLCACVASVCVCAHPWNKDVSKAIIGTFFQCLLQKMVGWVAVEVPLYSMLKLACENIRFSSLFAAREVSRGGTSAT